MTKHTTPEDAQLDVQIKELLGQALAQTPRPPDLEYPMLKKADPQPTKRNAWIIGGGIGLSAAAALVGLVIIPNLGDSDSIVTPPAGPGLPEVTTAITTAITTEGSESDEAVSTTPTEESTIVVAGPSGIGYENLAVDAAAPAGRIELTDTPAYLATVGPDGNIWFRRPVEDADGRPRTLDPDTGVVTPIDVPVADGHRIEFLDVAEVDGNLTVLYITTYDSCQGFIDPLCVSALRTFQPATGDMQILDEQIAWEAGWGPHQIADNGLVFGTTYGMVSGAPTVYNVGTGPTPVLGNLDIAPISDECVDCPSGFTIDRMGAHVAWVEGAGPSARIVITSLQSGERVEVASNVSNGGQFGDQLQIANIEITSGEVTAGMAVLSPRDSTGFLQPVAVDLTDGSIQTLTDGTIAAIT